MLLAILVRLGGLFSVFPRVGGDIATAAAVSREHSAGLLRQCVLGLCENGV